MLRTVFLILLGLFLFLTGLAAVTNFRFEWMSPIAGFAALLAGIAAFVVAYRSPPIV